MQKLIQILWPSFLVAGVVEAIFFTVINPSELYFFGSPVRLDAITTYSIGFFAFWLICAASSLTTIYFQRTANEINHPETKS